MTVLKGQAELDQYCLTKKEIAKELGISTNAVRCRMRSGNKDNLEYRFDGSKYLFKRPGVSRVNRPPSVRPPGRWNETNRKKKDWSKINRGATHRGEAKYTNDAFKYANEMKVLNNIQKKVPQDVFNRHISKISMAEREYQRELLEKSQGTFKEPVYYGGLNRRANERYTESYNQNFYNDNIDNTFNPRGKPQVSTWRNPYEITSPVDDGSVEINERDFPRDDSEPRFKNKVEESIYRAKKKYY